MGDVSAIGGAGPGTSRVDDLAAQRAAGRSHVSTQITAKNSSPEMRTGRSRSTLTPASASLRKVSAPTPGRFSIRTVSAGRIRYSMPALSSTVWAEASSPAMNATTPLPPCRRAQKEVDPAAGHHLAQADKLAGLIFQLHGEGTHPGPALPGGIAQDRRYAILTMRIPQGGGQADWWRTERAAPDWAGSRFGRLVWRGTGG